MNNLSRHIFLIGMPGCGKTSLGKRISHKYSLPFIDTDFLLSNAFQMSTEKILEKYGEILYRKFETKILISICFSTPSIVSTGGGLPLKKINQKIMKDNGYIIFIDRPYDRITLNLNYNKRPLLADTQLDEFYNVYNERHDIYDSIYDTKIMNISDINGGLSELDNIIKKLTNVENK